MALFGTKKEKEVVKEGTPSKEVSVSSKTKKEAPKDVIVLDEDFSWVLKKPHITEKAAYVAEKVNSYIFNVHPRANKKDVASAIKELYKVTPTSVNITRIAKKSLFTKGRKGSKGGGKKAYVFLKKGDRIEFV